MDIAAHNALAVGQINRFGTEEQKKKYLPRLTNGEWIGAWALTEPNAGSDTGGIETESEREGDQWQINGMKKFITSGRTAGSRRRHGHDRPDRQGQKRDQRFHFDEGSGHAGAKDSHLRNAGERDSAELRFENCESENCSANAGAAANRR